MEEGCTLAHVSGAISPSCWGGDSECVAVKHKPRTLHIFKDWETEREPEQSKAIPSRPTSAVYSKQHQGLHNFPHSITIGDRVLKPRSHGGHVTVSCNTQQNSSFSKLLLSFTFDHAYEQCIVCFPILYCLPDYIFTIVPSGQPKVGVRSICICASHEPSLLLSLFPSSR